MATVLFVVLSWVALMGALLFQCRPFWALWTLKRLSTAKCVKSELIYLAIAVVSFIADTIVFILPIPVVMMSGLPKGQKYHVLVVFFLGIIVILASGTRLILIARTVNLSHRDISRRIVVSMLAGVIELAVAVIVACLPACKMFLTKKFNIFVMPTTPQYIWTPEVTACRKAEVRLRDLEESDASNVSGPSESQTELCAVSSPVSEMDVHSIRSGHTRATSSGNGK